MCPPCSPFHILKSPILSKLYISLSWKWYGRVFSLCHNLLRISMYLHQCFNLHVCPFFCRRCLQSFIEFEKDLEKLCNLNIDSELISNLVWKFEYVKKDNVTLWFLSFSNCEQLGLSLLFFTMGSFVSVSFCGMYLSLFPLCFRIWELFHLYSTIQIFWCLFILFQSGH